MGLLAIAIKPLQRLRMAVALAWGRPDKGGGAKDEAGGESRRGREEPSTWLGASEGLTHWEVL